MASRRRVLGLVGAGVNGGIPLWVRAEPGVREDEVLIGRTTPASPPFTPMTMQRRVGANACIAAVNAAGGVHGRKLRIVDLDDAYLPERARANARQLIERDRVFALLGAFGTQTLSAVMSVAEQLRVPLVGATTLGRDERQPAKRYVFPVRISAQAETLHVVKHQKTLGVERFAILASKEGYGPEGAVEFVDALQQLGSKPVAHLNVGFAEPVEAVARQLLASDAQAVLASVLPPTLARVLKTYRANGGSARVLGFSSMRIEDLIEALGPLAAGMSLSQAVPVPNSKSVPLSRRFQGALATFDRTAAASYQGLDAYLEALVLVEGLQRAGRNLTREGLVDALESLKMHDFGGVFVKYGRGDRTGSTYIDIVMLGDKGRIVY